MPTLDPYKGSVYLWSYIPSLVLSLTFTIIFLLLTLSHTYKTLVQKTWYTLPFLLGGISETAGYTTRAVARYHTSSFALFLLQSIFLLLPPCLFAATLYMVYSRVVRSTRCTQLSFISPQWCTRVFVAGDLLCLNIQSGGAGLLPKPRLEKIGNGIIVAGLALQVVIFGGFMACCVLFHWRLRRYLRVSGGNGRIAEVKWESVLGMLYVTSVLICIRNVFRLVEFIGGQDGYLVKNEWPVYVFDGVLMVLVMLGFYVWYPPQLEVSSTDDMIELQSGDEASRGRSK